MFGLSVSKILLILAAFAVLVLAPKIVRQIGSGIGKPSPDADRPSGPDRSSASGDAADLIQCQACGAFAARNCGKPGCPLA